MGLLNSIKNDVKKSGQNKGKFIYFREGQKQRIRFLQDMDDGVEIVWHDSFEQGINVPCQEFFGRDCPYCEDDGLRTRNMYAWSVWNYETKEVQVFMFAVNNCSPIPALVAMYENYGTLCDRDYVISVSGKQQNKTFSVVPMDKQKFRNEKAKPFGLATLKKMIDKAWPAEAGDGDDDEEYEEEQPKKKRPTKSQSKGKKKPEPEDDYDDDYDDDVEDEAADDEEEVDYSEMSDKQLYKLCKERGIDVPTRKSQKFYIKQLEEYDQAQDDWNDDDEDDEEWEDDDE